MDTPTLTSDPGTSPSASPPAYRLPRWPFVMAAVFLVLGVLVVVVWPIRLPYFALSAGPVYDTDDFIEVTPELASDDGDLFFLTVSQVEVNVFQAIEGLFDAEIELVPRQNIRAPDESPEDQRRRSLAAMEGAKRNAIFVALTTLGYEPNAASISAVFEDTPADGNLREGDAVVSVDGEPVRSSGDLVGLVSIRAPGETILVGVERTVDGTVTSTEVALTLAENPDDPTRGFMGVLVGNRFPFEVVIDSQNIGGPSAGMMFTLQIIDLLTPEDITKGHRIAGTGTIQPDGAVGAIGGVRQKVYGAIDAGAEYMLVPADNFADAVAAAGDRIELVRVERLQDALDFMASLELGQANL